MQFHPEDSVTRFVLRKAFQEGGTGKMPLSVQGHRAVKVGVHISRFYKTLHDYLHHPDVVLGAV
jgi:chloramphenicol O-acetyltransferase